MATQQILNGQFLVIEGVKYTATGGDAELNVNGTAVSGIESGKVVATIDGATTTPEITLDGTTAFDFTAKGSATDGLNLVVDEKSVTYLSGKATYNASGISFPAGEVQLKLNNSSYAEFFGTVTATIPTGGFEMPFDTDLNLNVTNEITLTFDGVLTGSLAASGKVSYDTDTKELTISKDASLTAKDLVIDDSLAQNFKITALADSTVAIVGSKENSEIVFKDGSSFSVTDGTFFGLSGKVTINGGDLSFPRTSITSGNDEQTLKLTAGTTVEIEGSEGKAPIAINVEEDANVKIVGDKAARTITFSSDAESGVNFSSSAIPTLSLNVKGTIIEDNNAFVFPKGTVVTATVENGEISKSFVMTNNNGSFGFNLQDKTFSLAENSEIEITSSSESNTKMKLTNTEAAGGSFIFDKNGITITPDENDGNINISFSQGDQENDLTLEFKSGSLTLNNKNEISLSEGTEVVSQLGDASISFKTKGENSVKLEFTENGAQFTPKDEDGTVEVTISQGNNTNTFEVGLNNGSFAINKDNEVTLSDGAEIVTTLADGLTFDVTAVGEIGSKFEFTEEGIKATPTSDGSSVDLVISMGGSGATPKINLDLKKGSVLLGKDSIIKLADGTELVSTMNGTSISVTTKGETGSKFEYTEEGIKVSPTSEGSSIDVAMTHGEHKHNLNIDFKNGSVTFGKDSITLSDGAEIVTTFDDGLSIDVTATGATGSTVAINEEKGLTFTPDGDGSINLKVSKDGKESETSIDVKSGSISINHNNEIILSEGTEIVTTLADGTTFDVTTVGEVGSKVSFDEEKGFVFTPSGDGSINLKVTKGDKEESIGVDFKSGTVSINNKNEVSVTAGTELTVTFTEDYSITVKTTEEAGGKVSYVENGLKFTPSEGDGSLEVTVKNGETVRTATIDLTGAVTFTADGGIALDKDSVANFTFEDGAALKITANDDSSSKIKFNGEEGVTLTPVNVDSLTLELTTADGRKTAYEEVKGTISYSGGVITLEDGTSLKEVRPEPPEGAEPPEDAPEIPEFVKNISHYVKSVGGSSTIDFSESKKVIFTPGEGATLTTLGGVELTAGSLIVPETQKPEEGQQPEPVAFILTAGTVADQKSPRAHSYVLETAGEYTLNGNPIKTTADGVEVTMSGKDDHDAVEFDIGAAVEVTGHEISGDEGNKVLITGAGQDVGLKMYKAGTATLDGREVELTEDVERGIVFLPTEDGFDVSGNLTIEDVTGRATESLSISGSDDYKVKFAANGIGEISNVDGGSNIKSGGTFISTDDEGNTTTQDTGSVVVVVTKSAGEFTFGENAYQVTGDDSVKMTVVFESDGTVAFSTIEDLNGCFEGKVGEEITINGEKVTMSEGSDNLIVLADDESIFVAGVKDGAEVTFDSDKVEVLMDGKELTVNGVKYELSGDKDGVTIGKDGVTGLDKDALLIISPDGTYKVNDTTLDVTDGKKIVGTDDAAEIFKEISSNSTTDEILEELGIDQDKVTEVTEPETTLPSVSKNAAVVPEATEGETKVKMGDKGSAAVVENTAEETPLIITGGNGKDTLVSKGGDVTFDMAAGGKDQVIALDGKVTMDNYNPDTKAGIKLTSDQMEKGITFDTGKVILDNAEVAIIPEVVIGTDVDNFVNLYTPDNQEMKVGFATEANNLVDASKKKANMLLIGGGEYNGMKLANEIEDASLLGGSGNDTIISGEDSYIDAGAGKNYVQMSDEGGSTVNFTEGKTTLDNFNFVSEDEDEKADTLQTGKLGIDDVKVEDNGDVVLKTQNGNVTVKDGENKTIALQNDATDGVINMNVAKDEVKIADNGYYVAAGKNAKVDLSGYTGDTANVDLNNHNFNEKDAITFYGDVKDVDASGYKNAATLTGNNGNNVLTAGEGGTYLNGGKGNNTLIGSEEAADNFVTGEGNDVIKNFVAGFDDNADKISLAGGLDTVAVKGNDAILTVGDNKTTVEGLKGKTFQVANEATKNEVIGMQVSDKELNVDENGYYLASGKNAKVSLKDYTGSSAVVDLSDSNYNNGGLSFYGDIKTLDATDYEGDAVLYGNANSNSIIAGEGNSTLWGGNEGNDTLIGGDGSDTFIYGKGNGNDIVKNADEDDTIRLSGIALEDIMVRDEKIFSGNDVVFRINDGGTLTVKDGKTNGATYDIAGTQYVVNDEKFETK